MSLSDKIEQLPGNHIENNQGQPSLESPFLSGIKQRLLSFIFRRVWNEERDDALVGSLVSPFYWNFFLCLFHAVL